MRNDTINTTNLVKEGNYSIIKANILTLDSSDLYNADDTFISVCSHNLLHINNIFLISIQNVMVILRTLNGTVSALVNALVDAIF